MFAPFAYQINADFSFRSVTAQVQSLETSSVLLQVDITFYFLTSVGLFITGGGLSGLVHHRLHRQCIDTPLCC